MGRGGSTSDCRFYLADLIAKRAAVIVAVSGSAAVAKTTAGSTIPIVFMVGGDPVKLGLVTSINRPGGNLTGVSMLAPLLEPKRLELLRELVPHATTVGLVIDPQYADAQEQSHQVRAAGAALGLAVVMMPAHTQSEIVRCFCKTRRNRRVDALLVGSSPNLFRPARADRKDGNAPRHSGNLSVAGVSPLMVALSVTAPTSARHID